MAERQTDKAEQYVDQIDLLQPVSPATLTTRGYIALKRNKFDDAVKRADQILGINPDSINAAVLKARALDGAGRGREGAENTRTHLITRQHRPGCVGTLLVIYRHATISRTSCAFAHDWRRCSGRLAPGARPCRSRV